MILSTEGVMLQFLPIFPHGKKILSLIPLFYHNLIWRGVLVVNEFKNEHLKKQFAAKDNQNYLIYNQSHSVNWLLIWNILNLSVCDWLLWEHEMCNHFQFTSPLL